jgi:TonB family protein
MLILAIRNGTHESIELIPKLIFQNVKGSVLMKWTAGLITFCSSTTICSQNLSKEYFDRRGNECLPGSSYCYNIRIKNRDVFPYDTVRFYYSSNNRLQAIGLADQFGNRMGLHESFYENGNLKSKRRYEVNRTRKSVSTQDSINCVILEFSDSLGHPMVQNGEGMVDGRLDFLVEQGKVVNGLRDSVWTVFYDHQKVYCYESWHLGQLIDGISYDHTGQEYYYRQVLVLPEPVGGFQEFYRQTSNRITYPKAAQRRSIEGQVLVEVVVEKDGSVTSPRIAKGIGFGCDEEALKAVTRSSPWVPGKQRGQPINRKMIIPIVFKLN